jgi:CarD family transcriptional regulator
MAKKKQVNSKKSKGSKKTPSKTKSEKTATKKAPVRKTVAKKTAAKKAPVKKTAAKKTTAKKTAAKKTAAKKTAAKKAPVRKTINKTLSKKKAKLQYSVGDFIVYPSHGVGEVTAIQKFEIAEEKLEMYNVIFDKEKMTLKIPTIKAKEIGIRKVSSRNEMKKTLEILKGKAKVRRTMWSRRAQEYEAKINSGILKELTEVVRDLFRNSNQPEQSYSERQLYESARDRLAREVAVVEKTDDIRAVEKIEIILNDATRKTTSENTII